MSETFTVTVRVTHGRGIARDDAVIHQVTCADEPAARVCAMFLVKGLQGASATIADANGPIAIYAYDKGLTTCRSLI